MPESSRGPTQGGWRCTPVHRAGPVVSMQSLSRRHRDALLQARGAAPLPIPITPGPCPTCVTWHGQDAIQPSPALYPPRQTSATKGTQPSPQSFPWALRQLQRGDTALPRVTSCSADTLTWIPSPQLQIRLSLQPLQLLIYSPTHARANNSPGTLQPKPSPSALHPGLRALLQCCIASTAGKELLNFTKRHFSFCLRGFS